MSCKPVIAILLVASAGTAFADNYNIDPNHTYPSFEADHFGISVLRGKFTRSSGKVTLDRAGKTGSVDITIDANSVDFGHPALNQQARSASMFNTEKFPSITYSGKSIRFDGDRPVAVQGELTLLGVTKPVTLTINKFKCITPAYLKREVCGADASAEINRAEYGLGFMSPPHAPEVRLAIQVEAIKTE